MRFYVPPKTVADPVRRDLLGKSRTPDEVACSLPRASGIAAHERSIPLRAAFRLPDGPAAGRLSTLLAVTRLGAGRSCCGVPGPWFLCSRVWFASECLVALVAHGSRATCLPQQVGQWLLVVHVL